MSRNKFNSIPAAYVLLAIALLTSSAVGQLNNGVMSPPANSRPPRLENVGIEQHLDAQVPPDLTFRDDTGRTVKLGDYFGHKPLILNLVYYNCTMLCGEALAGLASAMRLVKFNVGDQFDVVTVSFDPRDPVVERLAVQMELPCGLRLAAAATILMLGGLIFTLWRLDRSVTRRTIHGGARTL